MENEKIEINGKILQLGVLSDDQGYQLYVYPGMSVNEIAFCHMVTIRLLMKDKHIKNKKEFDDLVKKYFTDPQFAPLEDKDESIHCAHCDKHTPTPNMRRVNPNTDKQYLCIQCYKQVMTDAD